MPLSSLLKLPTLFCKIVDKQGHLSSSVWSISLFTKAQIISISMSIACGWAPWTHRPLVIVSCITALRSALFSLFFLATQPTPQRCCCSHRCVVCYSAPRGHYAWSQRTSTQWRLITLWNISQPYTLDRLQLCTSHATTHSWCQYTAIFFTTASCLISSCYCTARDTIATRSILRSGHCSDVHQVLRRPSHNCQ